jgi:O-antigen ligase
MAVSAVCYYSERQPSLFANATLLGAVLILEVILASLWRFDTVFFPMTMGCFLLAGTSLPLSGETFTIRWLFLGVGALVGFALWMRTNRLRHFGLFHLVALFCVLAAVASASVSGAAKVGLLKVVSLFLLFMYASTGARFAFQVRAQSFVRRLVIACEISAFLVAATHFVGYDFMGNPNNMGSFVGVILAPVLLWAALTAEHRAERQRRWIALALCGLLLYASACRAAIVADAVVILTVTFALRRPRLLVRAVFVAALFLEIMAVASPSRFSDAVDNLGHLIYKTQGRSGPPGLLGSRLMPWDDTIATVKQHPWFGTGFGTSDLGSDQTLRQQSSVYTVEGTNREHGSSYLAIVEYMGLLGILPFVFLLALVVRAIAQIFAWTRRFGTPLHYGVPFALITLAGLAMDATADLKSSLMQPPPHFASTPVFQR